MNTIEQQALKYAKNYWKDELESINMAEAILYSAQNYIDGIKFAETWTAFEDELPEIKDKPYQVLTYRIDGGKERYQAIWINDQIRDWAMFFTHWRPITHK